MKSLVSTLVISLTLLVSNIAQAYVVDGLLSDWGVTPGIFGTSDWIPTPGVYYTEEDQNTYFLDPGYGGQSFDAEAMYIDFDQANLYFAIVTGFPARGLYGIRPGDIAFDFNLDDSYEYGIETTGNGVFTKGSLYTVSEWGKGLIAPTEILAAELVHNPAGTNLVYNKTYYGTNNKGNHYVIEGYIPCSYFGTDWGKSFRTHWTMTCGNDFVYTDIPASPVPEPGTMVLFGSGIFGLLASSFRRFFRQIKRGMDLVMAGLAILMTAPLWLMIAVAIKLTSKGPVFFNQERVGENKRYGERRKESRGAERRAGQSYGCSFTMYKFRTMKIDAEKETGAIWARENDPRITPLGRFLRKTHLDELPQLINVLRGQMSMIGPRPERAQIIPALNKAIKKYGQRLRVKPGITGLAQVRQHYDSTLGDVKKKVHYDLLYIRKMCLLMDLRIIFGTFVVMLTGKGAR